MSCPVQVCFIQGPTGPANVGPTGPAGVSFTGATGITGATGPGGGNPISTALSTTVLGGNVAVGAGLTVQIILVNYTFTGPAVPYRAQVFWNLLWTSSALQTIQMFVDDTVNPQFADAQDSATGAGQVGGTSGSGISSVTYNTGDNINFVLYCTSPSNITINNTGLTNMISFLQVIQITD